jgi:hypothetical protein
MAMCGLITTKEVLRHSAMIVREFGISAYLRCCVAIVSRHKTTFLNCVFAHH